MVYDLSAGPSSQGAVVPFTQAEEAQADADAVSGVAALVALTKEDVDIERERRIALPLAVTLPAGGKFTIDMDADSLRNLSGLATAGVLGKVLNSANTVAFRDHDNIMHNLTTDDLVSLGLAVQGRISAVYAKSWAVKALTPIPQNFNDDSFWV